MHMVRPFLAVAYALIIYAFIYLPVAILVLFSFQATRFPIPPFSGPSVRWYDAVLSDRRLMDGLWNSLAVAFTSSTVAALVGFLAAYALARHQIIASPLWRTLLTAPLTVSYLIIGMGLLVLFNEAGFFRSPFCRPASVTS